MKQSQLSIPLYHIDSFCPQGITFSYTLLDEKTRVHYKNRPHRDDYYMFLFVETAKGLSIVIDFQETNIGDAENVLLFVRPGQIHFVSSVSVMKVWHLAIAPMLIEEECKKVFEETFFLYPPVYLGDNVAKIMQQACTLLHTQMQIPSPLAKTITTNMANAIIGYMAEQYLAQQTEDTSTHLSRPMQIANLFRKSLNEHFRQVKSPIQYAQMLNYSLSHLNDSVKAATGFPVTYWIQQRIILETKRELYFTDKDVKEISFSLGYDDHAYFSRLFSKVCGESPLSFRRKYRK